MYINFIICKKNSCVNPKISNNVKKHKLNKLQIKLRDFSSTKVQENINRLCQKVSATLFLVVIVRHYQS